jgi:hypothetical protein
VKARRSTAGFCGFRGGDWAAAGFIPGFMKTYGRPVGALLYGSMPIIVPGNAANYILIG